MPDEDPEAWRSFMASLDPVHMLGPLAAHWNVSGRMCMCRATLRSACTRGSLRAQFDCKRIALWI
jgi:hypothetical protein